MVGPKPAVNPNGLVGVLAFTGIVAALMQTLVVPLIGDLPQILDTTASNASWIITATLVAGAVFVPITGRLGDLYGKRQMLLACTVPLIAGSVVCALATSVVPMIAGRALQGVGMGLIPIGISALRDLLPAERLNSSIALMSASMGIGGALGLPIAAAVAQGTSWRVLFWGATVLSVAIAVLIWKFVPATPVDPDAGKFDPVGAIGLGIGLVCLLLGVSKGADWGWASGTTLGLFAGAVVVLLAWGWWELRTSDPLVDLRTTARPQVLLTNVAGLVVGFAMYAQSLILPQLLQLPESTGYGLGQSMLVMGLWMAPGGFVMMALAPVGAKLSSARGPKITLMVGALIIALGYGSSMLLMGSAWGLMIVACICGAGTGFAYGAMPALIMSAVPHSETASANAFNTLSRSLGTSIAAAVVGVVLAQMSVQVGDYTLPTESGFRTGLLIGCGVALVAAAVAACIPSRRPVPSAPAPAADGELVAARG
ncbi:MFS transporter [Rhodococcus sp. NPDC058514]|uniref:MFS transporter n=1 Tax=unclassified Rhodococcus (in: high G+C Gram-positive bacteria) TaxID=192944 RepID=UPI003664B589